MHHMLAHFAAILQPPLPLTHAPLPRPPPQDIERMMIASLALFESGFERCDDLWHAYLLPPGQQPVNLRSGGCTGGGGEGGQARTPGAAESASCASGCPLVQPCLTS